jgi:hypothetical protein
MPWSATSHRKISWVRSVVCKMLMNNEFFFQFVRSTGLLARRHIHRPEDDALRATSSKRERSDTKWSASTSRSSGAMVLMGRSAGHPSLADMPVPIPIPAPADIDKAQFQTDLTSMVETQWNHRRSSCGCCSTSQQGQHDTARWCKRSRRLIPPGS